MAYEPTNWQNGDVITAEKLNKLEEGCRDSGPYVLDLTSENFALEEGSTTSYFIPITDEQYISAFGAFFSGRTVAAVTPPIEDKCPSLHWVAVFEGGGLEFYANMLEYALDTDVADAAFVTGGALGFEVNFKNEGGGGSGAQV